MVLQHTISPFSRQAGLAVVLICLLLAAQARAEVPFTVEAQVASRQVYVGQPFVLQLEISGADAVEQPAITLPDFRVEPQGGTNRSQSYRVFIDGKLQSSTTTSYTYQYLLTAAKAGTHTIPAIPVTVDGATATTTPITITVQKPEEIEAFKLRIQLAKEQCYLGEAVTMTTTWLISEELQGFEFNLPLFNDPRFALYAQTPASTGGRTELVEIEVAGARVIAEKKALRQNGRDYVSLVFRHTLVPQKTGTLLLPPASLAINAFAGYSQKQDRLFGADPLAMFGTGRRKTYRTVVIPANDLTLEVLALPQQGRPPHFSGLVGSYAISTEAGPTTVNVGDPITLTVHIDGPFVDNLTLPSLEANLPRRDFKVASDTPQAHLTAGRKSFTTTIRAGHDQVNRIPGLALPFFNPATRQYEEARSADIPLTVNPTRMITAADALGNDTAAAQAVVTAAQQDIRPNYETVPAPLPRDNGRLLTIAFLVLPPLFFILIFMMDYYRHDDSREARHRRRQAFRRFRKKLHGCEPDHYFEAWLEFLGDKLGRPARAITLDEVLTALAHAPEGRELAHQVREIFRQGEAALYGGMGHVLVKETLLRVAEKIAQVLS
jgi:hypothetical protein